MLDDETEKKIVICVMMMMNLRAACKVHVSVPQTVVNDVHFNQKTKPVIQKNAAKNRTASGGEDERYASCAFPLHG